MIFAEIGPRVMVADSTSGPRGPKGLRVADASIMPIVLSCNTMPSIMICKNTADRLTT
jgi:choline dehydrogenase-like flavoprotein